MRYSSITEAFFSILQEGPADADEIVRRIARRQDIPVAEVLAWRPLSLIELQADIIAKWCDGVVKVDGQYCLTGL